MMKKIILFSILLFACTTTFTVANSSIEPDKSSIRILIPPSKEKAYAIAGETFADMWREVTGQRPLVRYMKSDEKELTDKNVVLIGSDAVNSVVHALIRGGAIDGLDLQHGGDNYRILSLNNEGKNCLIVAGGSGRSTIYAVYDFFRKQAGVEYFWDGDVIPRHENIDISGIDILEKPHFEYRGLRYFAHRGLHRFQAEHWDLNDWKKEIDWLMKKRFNLFMLRTGIDDLFQRAFPEDVPYPPTDRQDPDANPRSYDDRTTFWSLKYRGELRKKVLEYARERGLLHPEDVGTITHWYSHTPSSFYKNNPDFPVITNQKSGYSLSTHAIWDIEKQETWDTYWKLTETHIKEYGGGSPRLFHTIGMAERIFGSSDRENLQMKLYVYNKTQQMLRETYPDVPLLIASWDFIGWNWKNEDVQDLIKKFDPKRTILLDYTADKSDKVTYHDWDVYKKFPWIFGIFHSLAKNTDIHEDYDVLAPRIREAAADPKCKGLVTWTEVSHSDTYLIDYHANNSWNPDKLNTDDQTYYFCKTRYPNEIYQDMQDIWNSFLNISQTLHWGWGGILFWEPQFRILSSGSFVNLTPQNIKDLKTICNSLCTELKHTSDVINGLVNMTNANYDNLQWRRDVLDMGRTIASRAYFASLAKGSLSMEKWRQKEVDVSEIKRYSELSKKLLATLSDLLSMSDDFSMYASLQKLYDAEYIEGMPPMVNPHSEQTLKGNSENDYCRSHHYELVEHVYRPELEEYWNWVFKQIKSGDRSEWKRPQEFSEQKKIIEDRFYKTSLKEMAPTKKRNARSFSKVLSRLNNQVNDLLKTEQ